MLKLLYFLLFTAIYWHYVQCRYLTHPPAYQHQPYSRQYAYSPYSYHPNPYGYAATPYYMSPQRARYQSPGTYFDQDRGIVRPLPGRGMALYVNNQVRCSDKLVGVIPHPLDCHLYYVCKPDCVILSRCPSLQYFNGTTKQCDSYAPPQYTASCTRVGRFPIYSDNRLYYRCDKNLQPYFFSCPTNMVFCGEQEKCVQKNECAPTEIVSGDEDYPNYPGDKIPPCVQNGFFRSPLDCSTYYECRMQNNQVFKQTIYRCSSGMFYDLKERCCLPRKHVPCDSIPLTEMIYPKPHGTTYHDRFIPPVFHPAEFDIESLEENNYPTEASIENIADYSEDVSADEDEIAMPALRSETTTTATKIVDTTTIETKPEISASQPDTTAIAMEFTTLATTMPTRLESTTEARNEPIESKTEKPETESTPPQAESETFVLDDELDLGFNKTTTEKDNEVAEANTATPEQVDVAEEPASAALKISQDESTTETVTPLTLSEPVITEEKTSPGELVPEKEPATEQPDIVSEPTVIVETTSAVPVTEKSIPEQSSSAEAESNKSDSEQLADDQEKTEPAISVSEQLTTDHETSEPTSPVSEQLNTDQEKSEPAIPVSEQLTTDHEKSEPATAVVGQPITDHEEPVSDLLTPEGFVSPPTAAEENVPRQAEIEVPVADETALTDSASEDVDDSDKVQTENPCDDQATDTQHRPAHCLLINQKTEQPEAPVDTTNDSSSETASTTPQLLDDLTTTPDHTTQTLDSKTTTTRTTTTTTETHIPHSSLPDVSEDTDSTTPSVKSSTSETTFITQTPQPTFSTTKVENEFSPTNSVSQTTETKEKSITEDVTATTASNTITTPQATNAPQTPTSTKPDAMTIAEENNPDMAEALASRNEHTSKVSPPKSIAASKDTASGVAEDSPTTISNISTTTSTVPDSPAANTSDDVTLNSKSEETSSSKPTEEILQVTNSVPTIADTTTTSDSRSEGTPTTTIAETTTVPTGSPTSVSARELSTEQSTNNHLPEGANVVEPISLEDFDETFVLDDYLDLDLSQDTTTTLTDSATTPQITNASEIPTSATPSTAPITEKHNSVFQEDSASTNVETTTNTITNPTQTSRTTASPADNLNEERTSPPAETITTTPVPATASAKTPTGSPLIVISPNEDTTPGQFEGPAPSITTIPTEAPINSKSEENSKPDEQILQRTDSTPTTASPILQEPIDSKPANRSEEPLDSTRTETATVSGEREDKTVLENSPGIDSVEAVESPAPNVTIQPQNTADSEIPTSTTPDARSLSEDNNSKLSEDLESDIEDNTTKPTQTLKTSASPADGLSEGTPISALSAPTTTTQAPATVSSTSNTGSPLIAIASTEGTTVVETTTSTSDTASESQAFDLSNTIEDAKSVDIPSTNSSPELAAIDSAPASQTEGAPETTTLEAVTASGKPDDRLIPKKSDDIDSVEAVETSPSDTAIQPQNAADSETPQSTTQDATALIEENNSDFVEDLESANEDNTTKPTEISEITASPANSLSESTTTSAESAPATVSSTSTTGSPLKAIVANEDTPVGDSTTSATTLSTSNIEDATPNSKPVDTQNGSKPEEQILPEADSTRTADALAAASSTEVAAIDSTPTSKTEAAPETTTIEAVTASGESVDRLIPKASEDIDSVEAGETPAPGLQTQNAADSETPPSTTQDATPIFEDNNSDLVEGLESANEDNTTKPTQTLGNTALPTDGLSENAEKAAVSETTTQEPATVPTTSNTGSPLIAVAANEGTTVGDTTTSATTVSTVNSQAFDSSNTNEDATPNSKSVDTQNGSNPEGEILSEADSTPITADALAPTELAAIDSTPASKTEGAPETTKTEAVTASGEPNDRLIPKKSDDIDSVEAADTSASDADIQTQNAADSETPPSAPQDATPIIEDNNSDLVEVLESANEDNTTKPKQTLGTTALPTDGLSENAEKAAVSETTTQAPATVSTTSNTGSPLVDTDANEGTTVGDTTTSTTTLSTANTQAFDSSNAIEDATPSSTSVDTQNGSKNEEQILPETVDVLATASSTELSAVDSTPASETEGAAETTTIKAVTASGEPHDRLIPKKSDDIDSVEAADTSASDAGIQTQNAADSETSPSTTQDATPIVEDNNSDLVEDLESGNEDNTTKPTQTLETTALPTDGLSENAEKAAVSETTTTQAPATVSTTSNTGSPLIDIAANEGTTVGDTTTSATTASTANTEAFDSSNTIEDTTPNSKSVDTENVSKPEEQILPEADSTPTIDALATASTELATIDSTPASKTEGTPETTTAEAVTAAGEPDDKEPNNLESVEAGETSASDAAIQPQNAVDTITPTGTAPDAEDNNSDLMEELKTGNENITTKPQPASDTTTAPTDSLIDDTTKSAVTVPTTTTPAPATESTTTITAAPLSAIAANEDSDIGGIEGTAIGTPISEDAKSEENPTTSTPDEQILQGGILSGESDDKPILGQPLTLDSVEDETSASDSTVQPQNTADSETPTSTTPATTSTPISEDAKSEEILQGGILSGESDDKPILGQPRTLDSVEDETSASDSTVQPQNIADSETPTSTTPATTSTPISEDAKSEEILQGGILSGESDDKPILGHPRTLDSVEDETSASDSTVQPQSIADSETPTSTTPATTSTPISEDAKSEEILQGGILSGESDDKPILGQPRTLDSVEDETSASDSTVQPQNIADSETPTSTTPATTSTPISEDAKSEEILQGGILSGESDDKPILGQPRTLDSVEDETSASDSTVQPQNIADSETPTSTTPGTTTITEDTSPPTDQILQGAVSTPSNPDTTAAPSTIVAALDSTSDSGSEDTPQKTDSITGTTAKTRELLTDTPTDSHLPEEVNGVSPITSEKPNDTSVLDNFQDLDSVKGSETSSSNPDASEIPISTTPGTAPTTEENNSDLMEALASTNNDTTTNSTTRTTALPTDNLIEDTTSSANVPTTSPQVPSAESSTPPTESPLLEIAAKEGSTVEEIEGTTTSTTTASTTKPQAVDLPNTIEDAAINSKSVDTPSPVSSTTLAAVDSTPASEGTPEITNTEKAIVSGETDSKPILNSSNDLDSVKVVETDASSSTIEPPNAIDSETPTSTTPHAPPRIEDNNSELVEDFESGNEDNTTQSPQRSETNTQADSLTEDTTKSIVVTPTTTLTPTTVSTTTTADSRLIAIAANEDSTVGEVEGTTTRTTHVSTATSQDFDSSDTIEDATLNAKSEETSSTPRPVEQLIDSTQARLDTTTVASTTLKTLDSTTTISPTTRGEPDNGPVLQNSNDIFSDVSAETVTPNTVSKSESTDVSPTMTSTKTDATTINADSTPNLQTITSPPDSLSEDTPTAPVTIKTTQATTITTTANPPKAKESDADQPAVEMEDSLTTTTTSQVLSTNTPDEQISQVTGSAPTKADSSTTTAPSINAALDAASTNKREDMTETKTTEVTATTITTDTLPTETSEILIENSTTSQLPDGENTISPTALGESDETHVLDDFLDLGPDEYTTTTSTTTQQTTEALKETVPNPKNELNNTPSLTDTVSHEMATTTTPVKDTYSHPIKSQLKADNDIYIRTDQTLRVHLGNELPQKTASSKCAENTYNTNHLAKESQEYSVESSSPVIKTNFKHETVAEEPSGDTALNQPQMDQHSSTPELNVYSNVPLQINLKMCAKDHEHTYACTPYNKGNIWVVWNAKRSNTGINFGVAQPHYTKGDKCA